MNLTKSQSTNAKINKHKPTPRFEKKQPADLKKQKYI